MFDVPCPPDVTTFAAGLFILRSSSNPTLSPQRPGATGNPSPGIVEVIMTKWTLSIAIILIGCALFLIPGVFSQPGIEGNDEVSAAVVPLETVLEELLNPGATTEQPAADTGQEPDVSPSGTGVVAAETADASEAPDYATVFPGVTVQRIDFAIAAEDWSLMIEEVSGTEMGMPAMGMRNESPASAQRPQANARPPMGAEQPARPGEPPMAGAMPGGFDMLANQTTDASVSYVPCTVRFQGQTWEDVGIRFKGNSTLRNATGSGSLKYPFHLDFDEFEDANPAVLNQRFFGFDDLSLGNLSIDASYVRQYVAAEIFRTFGVPTPEVAFYQVYLDIGGGEQFLGLYTMTETPDDAFLDEFFGSSSGNLYKPQGGSANWASFEEADFEKKSNEQEADWSDLEAVFEALHASRDDAAAWRAGLESVFDVDGFLQWLAINRLIGNWDSYGQMPQNYYLYTSPDGIVHWIPWDLNESFAPRTGSSTSIDLSSVGDGWPLISYVISDPVYQDVYNTYVLEALESVFSQEFTETLIRETFDAIAPFLVDESGDLSPYSFSGTLADSESAMGGVVEVAAAQSSKAHNYIDAQDTELADIIITEIHYNPSPEQGLDERYEFLELYNDGDMPVDLSGWQVDDGVVCSIPDGTVLEPGGHLVIAADADSYAHLDCQVLAWEEGKLSNGGETLRLVDEEGFWVDCVAYDDEGVWCDDADGNGPSLELVDASLPNHIAAHWQASQSSGGTPGT